MKKQQVEILAPAGSYECLEAAVCAGADAVYVGGSRFGARAYAENFQEKELLEALDYVHIHGRKMYLTVNTLIKESELMDVYDFLLPFYRQGLDGVIVQDLGAGELIREAFPDMELHASTQMTVTGAGGAAFLKEKGYVRVVPARELSLEEIRNIKEKTGLAVECFVHGALCYCYSGQCLMSSMIGGRSGNRGQCAQPCRLPYAVKGEKPADLMSMKDLCTIDLLPELLKAGIDSFKIEGRMKRPEYVAEVVEIYRRYADLYLDGTRPYAVKEEDRRRLYGAYQRRGYTEGYYRQHKGKQMISLKRPAEKKKKKSTGTFKIQEKINGKLTFSPENHVKLLVEYQDLAVECEGPVPESALRQPLNKDRVEKQMRKTGNSEFQFENLEIFMEGNLFLSMQAVNELRRNALERLTQEILAPHRRNVDSSRPFQIEKEEEGTSLILSALVQSVPQLEAAADCEGISRIYIDSMTGSRPVVKKIMEKTGAEKEFYLAMPYIFREEIRKKFGRDYASVLEDYDGVLIRNLESLNFLREKGYDKPVRADYNLYVCNRYSRELFLREGIQGVTASPELNQKELFFLGIQGQTLAAYGYQPVMVTANCIRKTTGRCEKKPGYLYISDRYRKKFAVKTCCDYCYNVIYNSAPLFLADLAEEIRPMHPGEIRLDFSTESGQETSLMIHTYHKAFLKNEKIKSPEMEYTRGHFKRGVK